MQSSDKSGSKVRGECLLIGTSLMTFLSLALLAVFVMHGKYEMQKDIDILRSQVIALRYDQWISKLENREFKRSHIRQRRQIVRPIDEDVPIVDSSYTGNIARNTEGLRIYDAFFQHPREDQIPHDLSQDWDEFYEVPILPHHRKSAKWVEIQKTLSQDKNRGYFAARKLASARQSDEAESPISMPMVIPFNRAKYTPIVEEMYSEAKKLSTNFNLETRAANNRNSIRSNTYEAPSKIRRPSASGLSEAFTGLRAIHYVATINPVNPTNHRSTQEVKGLGRLENEVGVFDQWVPARWSRRMGTVSTFPLTKDGQMRITQSGVYYLYAQINYMDPHDVNSYQILANDKPLFSCTSMTQTLHPQSDKTNTCFTGGVTFLEKGDLVSIHDLQPGRFSVLISSHSFFGAIQLSKFGDH